MDVAWVEEDQGCSLDRSTRNRTLCLRSLGEAWWCLSTMPSICPSMPGRGFSLAREQGAKLVLVTSPKVAASLGGAVERFVMPPLDEEAAGWIGSSLHPVVVRKFGSTRCAQRRRAPWQAAYDCPTHRDRARRQRIANRPDTSKRHNRRRTPRPTIRDWRNRATAGSGKARGGSTSPRIGE